MDRGDIKDETRKDETRARIRRRAAAAELDAMIDAALSPTDRRVILVDGFNVLHATVLKEERESGWWKRAFRERLLRRVGAWPGTGDDIWVAFDGAQPSWSVWAEPVAKPLPRCVKNPARGPDSRDPSSTLPQGERADARAAGLSQGVVHSVYVESADDWIVRRARKTDHPERTVVVTADRQVAGRARSAGCEIWTPWTFLSRCPSHAA